ncbi:helix-turn-helix domain-containing protein [Nesterenkonia halotolerans]|uniref:helix-turn-helix domain-containing protein n=1 Tax=Nesterenkonia halotolerans TaxID=225325 RepID=UPI003EE67452
MTGYRHPDTVAPHNTPGLQRARMLDTKALAELLDVSVDTVKRMRRDATGPRFITVSGSIRYAPWDVRAWIEGNASQGGK